MVGIEFRGRKDAVVAVLALVQFTVAAGLGRGEGALSRSTAAGTATGGSTNNAGRTAGVCFRSLWPFCSLTRSSAQTREPRRCSRSPRPSRKAPRRFSSASTRPWRPPGPAASHIRKRAGTRGRRRSQPGTSGFDDGKFFGMNGHALLMIGLLFCVGGLLFGLAIYVQLKEPAGSSLDARNFRTDL